MIRFALCALLIASLPACEAIAELLDDSNRLHVRFDAEPEPVRPGGWAELSFRVTHAGAPAANAAVKLHSHSGVFEGTNTNVLEGETDAEGVLRTRYRDLDANEFSCYEGTYEMTKPGADSRSGYWSVDFVTPGPPRPTVPECFVIELAAATITTCRRQWTDIELNVRNQRGQGVPVAEVVLFAPRGLFRSNEKKRVTGETHAEGYYRTEWMCSKCSGPQAIRIKVSKDGYITTTKELCIVVQP